MLKDNNQLSTIFLLGILSLLIYCLTKPKTTVSENFASEENNTSVPSVPNTQNIVVPNINTELSRQPVVETQPIADVRPELLNQVLVEAETTVPSTESNIQSNQMDVFQYEPNDIYNTGAELDNAFQLPIPLEKRTDVVDINKNNVKKYDAKDFLPKEINNQWFDTDFSQAKFNLNDDKLINTERYVIGVNTVGQSLKNASYDIRGTIPNPKFTVSPWNNSTYEPDFNLKSLC